MLWCVLDTKCNERLNITWWWSFLLTSIIILSRLPVPAKSTTLQTFTNLRHWLPINWPQYYSLHFVQMTKSRTYCFCYRWKYETEEELEGRSHWGRITHYSGGGFTMLLKATREKTKPLIKVLKVCCKMQCAMCISKYDSQKLILDLTSSQSHSGKS